MAGTKAPTSVRPEKAIEEDDASDWMAAPLGSAPGPVSSSKRPGQYSSVAPRTSSDGPSAPPPLGGAPPAAHAAAGSSPQPPLEKPLAPASRLAALVSAPGPATVARVALSESVPSSSESAPPSSDSAPSSSDSAGPSSEVTESARERPTAPAVPAALAVPADSVRPVSELPASSRRGRVTGLSEWQQVWLAMQSRPWKSIALVPADKSASDPALRLAHALVEIGTEHLKQAMEVLDFRRVSLGEVEARIGDLTGLVANGKRTLVVIGSILDSPACHRLARSADGALLCVTLGSSNIASAKKSVEAIGKDRFLGSVAFRASKAKAKPRR